MGASRLALTGILVVLGAGWGLTQPLTKITVTAGYQPFGIIFWQMLIGAILTALILRLQGKPLPFSQRAILLWVFVAVGGTLIPNGTSYAAAAHLPSGVMSIVIATIPLYAFPIALALGNDTFAWRRLLGLAIGLAGVALIALPETSLPERAMLAFLPLALIAPLCYAIEGNVIAKIGTRPLDPVQLLCGASALGTLVALPLALFTGQFIPLTAPFILADATMVLSSMVHVLVYAGYFWLAGRAGAVFAGQVSYLVTGFGVLWAIILLGESYSGWVWAALACMALGITLVQPRAVETGGPIAEH